tara:strand:+ start:297 stop:530 length:234 start_codon:yes stop_codon:yes gene_type:complete
MKPTKNKPAKRKSNPLVTKLLDLKYRINDTYHNSSKRVDRNDKNWVMLLIADVRDNNWTKLSKEDMLKCNAMWRKYE